MGPLLGCISAGLASRHQAPQLVCGPYKAQPLSVSLFFSPTTNRGDTTSPRLLQTLAVSDPAAAAAMPFTPGPYSGVSTLALVARASAFGVGVVYGTIKLSILKATKPKKEEAHAAHH
ncbi:hypothetical protein EJB05_56747, partial [Eragrostis curvula]